MISETKFIPGGDGTILAAFSQEKSEPVYTSEINRLIIECRTSKEALCELYRRFKSSVFAIAFSITADYHLSEDCVEETFVRLAQLKKFSASGGDGKGIIYTVARYVSLEYRRKFKRKPQSSVIQTYGDADEIAEDSVFVNQLLQHLNDKQRQVVVLKCCAGLTFKEIAKIMKSPESTIKSRYWKAMSILREKAGVEE